MQRRSSRGQKGAGRKAKGLWAGDRRWKQVQHPQANCHQFSQTLLFQQPKMASLNTPAEAGAQCVGGVIISVHTCRD